jgi:hypothetical protein
MKIYLIGVYHNFQTEKHPDFLDCLRDTCSTHKIRSIAEEMNNDALRIAKVEKSTILEIAEELGLPHAYCDPDANERRINGILGQQELKFNQWFYELSDKDAETLKSQHDGKREKFWLEKIREVFVDPMLFICGIQHLDSFSSLLRENGYNCCLIERKWPPNKILESDA